MDKQLGSGAAVEQHSAVIIPFPVRPPAALQVEPVLALPDTRPEPPVERLSTALSSLSTALTEQQAAIQRWRQAMTDLAGCMQKLSGGLERMDQAGPRAS